MFLIIDLPLNHLPGRWGGAVLLGIRPWVLGLFHLPLGGLSQMGGLKLFICLGGTKDKVC